ncbi:5-oxoprolinase subunit PxpA [Muricauda sp. JGD-17]|uniref:5-oxoprolinase subunit PxpA n=1 Tax=Flagellimonas ochracea TaxID=2696472 RepID=A0A964T9Q7_9FLAO|nr:5-oxoprolinase subunit PxpA [Allomuricauda ochracea]NAY90827.1 5-oxoprolinase subunit PxpA [Allomuricauda ochracea]
MKSWQIDINCDVGEGIGNETLLFPHISSCNIACGGHAGDIESMTEVVRLAKRYEVKIGAHPSYPDKQNFGREVIKLSDSALKDSIRQQMADFERVLRREKCSLHHIKAHGALYNQTAKEVHLAKVYLEALKTYKEKTLLYVPYGSIIAKIAKDLGFSFWYEAFADRNYTEGLQLVSRKKENALIQEPDKVLKHILPMIKQNQVVTVTGNIKEIKAQTYCVHGDTVSALEILMYLSKELPNHQVQLQK